MNYLFLEGMVLLALEIAFKILAHSRTKYGACDLLLRSKRTVGLLDSQSDSIFKGDMRQVQVMLNPPCRKEIWGHYRKLNKDSSESKFGTPQINREFEGRRHRPKAWLHVA